MTTTNESFPQLKGNFLDFKITWLMHSFLFIFNPHRLHLYRHHYSRRGHHHHHHRLRDQKS